MSELSFVICAENDNVCESITSSYTVSIGLYRFDGINFDEKNCVRNSKNKKQQQQLERLQQQLEHQRVTLSVRKTLTRGGALGIFDRTL